MTFDRGGNGPEMAKEWDFCLAGETKLVAFVWWGLVFCVHQMRMDLCKQNKNQKLGMRERSILFPNFQNLVLWNREKEKVWDNENITVHVIANAAIKFIGAIWWK